MDQRQEHRKEFDNLISAFIDIGNQLAGERIEREQEFLYYAEGLGQKLINHILTIRELANGYSIEGCDLTIDFGSIAILARSVLETYLTLHYLFVSPVDEDEKQFKLHTWFLGGLDRIKYKPAFADNIKKYEDEVERAANLREVIQRTSFFGRLSEQQKKDVLNGHWRIGSWVDLAKKAGFDEGYFRKQYMFLSTYAHSNHLSVIQIQQIKELDSKQKMAEAFFVVPMIVLGKYSYDYVQLIPGLKDKTDFTSPKYQILQLYKEIGEQLNNNLGA
jgi:hypothetical protein